VADHIYPLQADTAIIYVCSPIKKSFDFTISGIPDADSDTVQAMKDAIIYYFLIMVIRMVQEKFIYPILMVRSARSPARRDMCWNHPPRTSFWDG
jgi:hypothetical protein